MHFQHILAIIFLRISLGLAAAIPQNIGMPKPNLAKTLPRVIGGHPVSDNRFNFVSRITIDNPTSESLCSGSLIVPTVVLTAAHCLIDKSGLPASGVIRVTFGHSRESSGYSIYARNAYIHPDYSANVKINDIGLLILDIAVPAGLATPAKIYTGGYNESTVFTIAGYGLTNDNTGPPSDALIQADLRIGDKQFCEHSYPPWDISTQICLAHNNGRDACEGDSGGPAAIYDENAGTVVIGVTSFGAGSRLKNPKCGDDRAAGYYTDASKYIGWIGQVGSLLTDEFTYSPLLGGAGRRPYGGNTQNEYLSEFVKSLSVSGTKYVDEEEEYRESVAAAVTMAVSKSSGSSWVRPLNTFALIAITVAVSIHTI